MSRGPQSPKEALAVVAGVSLWLAIDMPLRFFERRFPNVLAWLRGGDR